jgi:hypothetical protein
MLFERSKGGQRATRLSRQPLRSHQPASELTLSIRCHDYESAMNAKASTTPLRIKGQTPMASRLLDGLHSCDTI